MGCPATALGCENQVLGCASQRHGQTSFFSWPLWRKGSLVKGIQECPLVQVNRGPRDCEVTARLSYPLQVALRAIKKKTRIPWRAPLTPRCSVEEEFCPPQVQFCHLDSGASLPPSIITRTSTSFAPYWLFLWVHAYVRACACTHTAYTHPFPFWQKNKKILLPPPALSHEHPSPSFLPWPSFLKQLSVSELF